MRSSTMRSALGPCKDDGCWQRRCREIIDDSDPFEPAFAEVHNCSVGVDLKLIRLRTWVEQSRTDEANLDEL